MSIITFSGNLYIAEFTNNIQYSTDLANWNNVTFPLTLNTTGDSNLNFVNSLTIDNSNDYFIISATDGNLVIDSSGSVQNIAADGYSGLFQNGNFETGGQSNVTIQNFSLNCTGAASLNPNNGWLCQQYYGNNASGNQIINCNSNGSIADYAGGIVGGNCANEGFLEITKCYSLGNIGQGSDGSGGSGGIVGDSAGNVSINNCYSIGNIGQYSGGIAGSNCGVSGYVANIQSCYSIGNISSYGGGITGQYTAANYGIVLINNCYSLGTISSYAGGITGAYTSENDTSSPGTTISNSYTTASGIIGLSSAANVTNCYHENGSWNISNASDVLYASGWISYQSQPYLLEYFNTTSPYITNHADVIPSSTTYQSLSEYYPNFLLINNISGVSINLYNGAITVASNVTPQTFILQILNYSTSSNNSYYPYSISNFTLNVFIPPNISNDPVFNQLLRYDTSTNTYRLTTDYTAPNPLYITLPEGSIFNGNNYVINFNQNNTEDLFQIQALTVSPANQKTIIMNLGVVGNTEIISNTQNVLISNCNFNINNNSVVGNNSCSIQLYNIVYTGYTSLIANNCKKMEVNECKIISKLLYQSKIGAITGIGCKNIQITKCFINTELFNRWNSGIVGYKNKRIYVFDTKVDAIIYTYKCASFICSSCQNITLIQCSANIKCNFKYYKYYIPKCYNITIN